MPAQKGLRVNLTKVEVSVNMQQPQTKQTDKADFQRFIGLLNSDVGLGGAILQPDDDAKLHPVAITSCTLCPTECYSQIEKE